MTHSRANSDRSTLYWVVALLALFIATVLVVGPIGNFPLDDDWAFVLSTQQFFATGTWHPSSWISMPLIFESIWAAPACVFSSCDFNHLRFITLLSAALLLCFTFLLTRLTSRGAAIPLFAAALVAFNPIAYTLSFTFMGDILFSALITAGALLFILALRRQSPIFAVMGTVVALAATMTRQLGLCLPLAFMVVYLLQTRGWRPQRFLGLLPLLLCGGSLALLDYWLRVTGRVPAQYDLKLVSLATTLDSLHTTALRFGHNLATIVLYAGLFCLPLFILTSRARVGPTTPRWLRLVPQFLGLVAVVLILIDLISRHVIMPSGGNILTAQGVGPALLRDVGVLGLPNLPSLPSSFWVVVTVLGVAGAYALVERFAAAAVMTSVRLYRHSAPVDPAIPFILLAVLSYTAPLMLIPLYDRYLIPILPLTLFLMASVSEGVPAGQFRRWTASGACLAFGTFSVLAVHDYMAWNRARWAAIADLGTLNHAGPDRIDGGFEYNGLYSYNPTYTRTAGKSWWWVDHDDYQITFGRIDGMTLVRTYPYHTLLPPAERSILVLAKQPAMAEAGHDPTNQSQPNGLGR